jgi:hypothetical protein
MEEVTFVKGKAVTWYGTQIFDVLIPSDTTNIASPFTVGLMNRLDEVSRITINWDIDKDTCFILLSDVERFNAEFEAMFYPASIISEPVLIDGVGYAGYTVGWIVLE